MKPVSKRNRASGALAIGVAAAFALLAAGSAWGQARIDGIAAGATPLAFTAKAGEVSTPDGGSIHFWGYQEDGNLGGLPAGALPQYPGPTLIVNQGDTVTINFKSALPFGQCSSMVFPGHRVTATGGSTGLLTQESCATIAAGAVVPGPVVTYAFTATEPGTYTYNSGTKPELQVEMGLVGAIIVRPSGQPDWAYADASTSFNHEVLFLLSSMDPTIHQLAEQNRFGEINLTARWPVYWFINGRAAPDDLVGARVGWLPHQPYNCTPRMTPGQKLLVRIIGSDQDQHALHLHGNHYPEIARYGRLVRTSSGGLGSRKHFTTLSVPGQTVDAMFEWTGEKLGWDIYGGTDVWPALAHTCNSLTTPSAGFDPITNEYCPDHGKPFPVILPEKQNLAFGGWYSGSPYLGRGEPLPPGEGGLNPNNGYFFMWHSHTEKELTNFDIFPGGMLSMMVMEPPGTPIP
jgi:FtsP/CotA-like multicopper oxidase with cupredoxin domain